MPFITVKEISEKITELSSIVLLLNKENIDLRKNINDRDCYKNLPEKIAQESYQIEINEAELISLALCNPSQTKFLHRQLFLNSDYFLKEPVFVSVITMPDTYWHIITVIPYSSAIQPGIKIYNHILSAALLAAFISLMMIMIFLRKFFKRLTLFSTFNRHQDNLSYLANADSSLPMLETVQAKPFIGSWRWNIKKRSLWWSDELYQFYGKDPQKFKPTLKHFVQKIIHLEDVDNVLSIVKNAVKNHTACGVEFRIILNNGDVKYVHVQAKIVQDSSGNTRVISGSADDITQQRELQADLVLSAATFQTQDAIIITDTQANILKVNKAFTQITSYSAEEVLGKNPKFLKSGRQDESFYQKLWLGLIEKGQFEGEIWNRHKNGSLLPQRITITATKNLRGKVVNFIAIYSAGNNLSG